VSAVPADRADWPDWCGRCSKWSRLVEVGLERQPARCPHCHPGTEEIRQRAAARPPSDSADAREQREAR
jgi:hypothetical protein